MRGEGALSPWADGVERVWCEPGPVVPKANIEVCGIGVRAGLACSP